MLLLLALPFPLVWTYAILNGPKNRPLSIFQRTFMLLGQNFGRVIGLNITLLLTGILFFSIVDTVLFWFFLDLVSWVVNLEPGNMDQLSVVLLTFISCSVIFLISTMLLVGFGLLYYVLVEIRDAPMLMEQVQQIGSDKKIRGLSRE